jgi:hypothetical protein
MSDNGDWSDESNKDTPLPPRLALAARAVSEEMMMETAADFDVASSIFGERSGSKAKRAKGNMVRVLWAPVTPTSSTPAPSMSGTTLLSYASMASPALSSGSRAQATPTPSHRPSPQDSFIGAFCCHVQSFDSSVDHNVLTSSEVACALKHICRLITVPGVIPIKSEAITSTSFLKVIDIPHIPAEPRVWLTTQRSAFLSALRSSPVGALLDKYIKHAPRFMRTSPHADTCVAWIDISDF